MTEEIEQIKKKIFNKNSEEIHINRVPKETVALFKHIAKEEFCGDYGLFLKNLLDEVYVKQPIYLKLQEQIYILFEKFEKFENNVNIENAKKIIKNDNGSRIIKKE